MSHIPDIDISDIDTKQVLLNYRNQEHKSTIGSFMIPVTNLIPHPDHRFIVSEHVQLLVDSFISRGIVPTRDFIAFAPKDWARGDELTTEARFEVVSGNHRLYALKQLQESGRKGYEGPRLMVHVLNRTFYDDKAFVLHLIMSNNVPDFAPEDKST